MVHGECLIYIAQGGLFPVYVRFEYFLQGKKTAIGIPSFCISGLLGSSEKIGYDHEGDVRFLPFLSHSRIISSDD